MKRDIVMKKSSFVNGALITTIGIIITKILGVLYVIPFHAIIGETGGALYGYAYTIYLLFMSLSSAGIPLAISRIVSEYQTLGYYNIKKRAFVLGKRIALVLGIISFMIIMIFAPLLAKAVMGDVVGGNTVEDIAFVIRVIGTAILIVPILSIYRGYFEGHRFMSAPSISQVLEQLVRVLIIIFGSLISIKYFNLNLTTSVGVALFGATMGALVSYIYLVDKLFKNKTKFNIKARDVNEPYVSDKIIIKKIIMYAFPFIMIDIFKSLYSYIDMFTVVKGLVDYAKYSAIEAETVYSILSTWGAKFNMIVLSISTGVVVSLIPNLTESIVKKDKKQVNKKIVQALSILLYLTVPITFGISFLSEAIWTLFYGESIYGSSVLSYYIFVGLFTGLFTTTVTVLQTLKDYKSVLISLCIGVLIKLILNISLLRGFMLINLPPYYGVITATIIGYLVSFISCLIILKYKYKVVFENIIKYLIEILCGSILMILVLTVIGLFVPTYSASRIVNLVLILFYGIVGAIVYFMYINYSGITNEIFGKNIINSIKKLILKK